MTRPNVLLSRALLPPGVLALSLVCSCAAWAAIDVDGDRVTVETRHGRVVIDRGVVATVENRLAGETYTSPDEADQLAGLRWPDRPKLMDANARVSVVRLARNRVRMSAMLAHGSKLDMTVEIDEPTQDILISQHGESRRKRLYAAQWGISGLGVQQCNCLEPGYGGLKLGRATPHNQLDFDWPKWWAPQMMIVEGQRGGFWVLEPGRGDAFQDAPVAPKDWVRGMTA